MKHASAQTLEHLEQLLGELRNFAELKEKKPGIFYYRSGAFLHFHEDPTGIFADVKIGDDWLRIEASGEAGQQEVLHRVSNLLKSVIK